MEAFGDEFETRSGRFNALKVDRRRPGRPAGVDAGLLPLLRGQHDDRLSGAELACMGMDDSPDTLSPVRGTLAALVISALLWRGIIYLVQLLAA